MVGAGSTVITISSVDEVHVPLLIVHLNVLLDPIVNPVTALVGLLGVVTTAVPLTVVHAPVPIVAVFAFKVVVVVLHNVWSVPAAAVVGKASIVITTSSVLLVQLPFAIVHLNVTLVPAVNPVNPVLAVLAAVIVAVPLTTLHVPVPTVGAFPAKVAVVLLQIV